MSPGAARDRLLTVGEVARLAGCSTDTVRSWDREGLLPARRTMGNQRRFLESGVIQFLQASGGKTNKPARSASVEAGRPASKPPPVGSLGPRRPSPSLIWVDPSPLEIELQDEAAS